MTTIAWDEDTVAFDSRETEGGTIVSDEFNKSVKKDGIVFFFAGSKGGIEPLINAYLSQGAGNGFPGIKALVLDDGKLYQFIFDTDIDQWIKYTVGPYGAMGSGRDHALTAMDMGADAKTAVQMAKKRDKSTGGKIRIFKLPKRIKG